MSFDLSDYVDVAERISVFKEKYPEGSLQSEVVYLKEPFGVLCVARAYRSPDDERPGVGHAFEPIPGSTPYTKDSETMNAETSAWGRAIVALGFQTKKIASADEVRARSGAEPSTATKASEPDRAAASAASAPESPVARAQAAAEQAKADRTPQDDGAPENVELTFGKFKGQPLGSVPRDYLEWLVGNYEPKNAEQRRIYTAAELVLGLVPAGMEPIDDGIPF